MSAARAAASSSKAETLRDGRLAAQLDEGYAAMRAAWTTLVEAYRG
ncbi:hypothetical protein [Streptomyces sp. bgisy029]